MFDANSIFSPGLPYLGYRNAIGVSLPSRIRDFWCATSYFSQTILFCAMLCIALYLPSLALGSSIAICAFAMLLCIYVRKTFVFGFLVQMARHSARKEFRWSWPDDGDTAHRRQAVTPHTPTQGV